MGQIRCVKCGYEHQARGSGTDEHPMLCETFYGWMKGQESLPRIARSIPECVHNNNQSPSDNGPQSLEANTAKQSRNTI